MFLFSLTVILLTNSIDCVKLIPERTTKVVCDPKFVNDLKVYIRRSSRRGDYYMNIEGTLIHEWNNNVSFHAAIYENVPGYQYKKSILSINFKLCDGLRNDPLVGRMLANTGYKCPYKAGRYLMNNMAFPNGHLEFIFPYSKAVSVVDVNTTSTNERICHGTVYIRLVEENKKV